MPTITIGTENSAPIELYYEDHGTGRPVVLLHGYPLDAQSWEKQQRALLAAGYRVVAYDRRGFGRSGKPAVGYDCDTFAADLRALLEALDLRDATLVGQSMGGNAVWALVERFGTARVRDLVIVDQTPCMLNHDDWPYGFYDYGASNVDTLFATGIPDPGRFPAKSKGLVRVARMLRALDIPRGGAPAFTEAELALLADHAKRDWRPAVARVDVPVLFVAGAESEVWPSGHAAAAASLNPLAESVVIERDGHAANIEQPAAFNRILLDWLAKRTS